MKIKQVHASRTGLTTGAVLSLAMLFGSPLALAANADTSMCQDLERAERGLCRAAIRSGCGQDGRNQDSIHCAKLASNYRQMSGGNMPVWLKKDEPAPVDSDFLP